MITIPGYPEIKVIGPKQGLLGMWEIGWKFATDDGRRYGEVYWISDNSDQVVDKVLAENVTPDAILLYRRLTGRFWRLWHWYGKTRYRLYALGERVRNYARPQP